MTPDALRRKRPDLALTELALTFLFNSTDERARVFAARFADELPDIRFIRSGDPHDPADIRYLITWTAPENLHRYANLEILVSIGAFWAKETFDRAKLVTAVEATERPATISPYEIMVTRGKELPVETFTADPF